MDPFQQKQLMNCELNELLDKVQRKITDQNDKIQKMEDALAEAKTARYKDLRIIQEILKSNFSHMTNESLESKSMGMPSLPISEE